MDTFMDKLAQKLTAQEMIKANTAADAEELNQLKGQIKEYHECLAQMQKVNQEMQDVNERISRLVGEQIAPEISRLVESGVLKLEGAQVDASGINRLVEESYAQIQKLAQEGVLKLENAKVDADGINRLVEESIQKIQEIQRGDNDADQIKQFQEEVKQIQEETKQLQEETRQVLTEKLDGSGDTVHRECVKVYRNVQAVVVEESGKQTEGVNEAVKVLKGKLGAVFGVAIAALVFSLGGVVLQILNILHVF